MRTTTQKILHKTSLFLILMLFTLSMVSANLEVSVNNYDPQPAEAGEYVDVWFKVQNTGTKSEENIFIEVQPKDGIELTSGESAKKKLGFVGVGQQTVKYRFRIRDDAIEGPNRLDVLLLEGEAGKRVELFLDVINNQADLFVGDVNSEPDRIKPDDEDVKIDVVLLNLGEGSARGLKAELIKLPEGITASSSYSATSLVGDIPSSLEKTATFYIDVDESVKPGVYETAMRVSYKTSTDTNAQLRVEEIPLTLDIQSVPLYQFTNVEFTPQELQAGMKDVAMTVTIKNVGEEDGESVRIKVFSKSEQPFTFEVSSDFVAPILKPGQESQATLSFDIDDNANLQDYLLDVEIRNVVNNDVITYEKTIPISVTKAKGVSIFPYVLMGIIALAVFFGYRYWKKKEQRKRAARGKQVQHHYAESYLEKLMNLGKKKKKN